MDRLTIKRAGKSIIVVGHRGHIFHQGKDLNSALAACAAISGYDSTIEVDSLCLPTPPKPHRYTGYWDTIRPKYAPEYVVEIERLKAEIMASQDEQEIARLFRELGRAMSDGLSK